MSKVDNPDSIARRARTLGAVSRELGRMNRTLRGLAGGPARREISGASVRAMVAARRLRDGCFDPSVGDIAWVILLDAYAARLEGRLSPMTGLGAPAGLARSTAHRWVGALLERGLLTRQPDPHDDRIALIGLSEDAAARIRDYLSAALKQAPLLP